MKCPPSETCCLSSICSHACWPVFSPHRAISGSRRRPQNNEKRANSFLRLQVLHRRRWSIKFEISNPAKKLFIHDDFVTAKVCNYTNPTWLGFVHMYEHCFRMCALRVSIVFPLSHDFPRVTCRRWSTLKWKQVSCIYMWVQAVDSEVKTGFLLCETLQTLEPRSIHSWLKKDRRKSFATIRANSVAMHATIIELMLYLQVSAHPVFILLY